MKKVISKYNLLIFNILFILFMDICFKLLAFNQIFNITTIYMILFDLIFALIITILESLFNEKINKVITFILTIFTSLIIIAQYVYFLYYDAIFSIYSLFHGAQVFGFIGSIIEVMLQNVFSILLLIVPLITFFLIFKKLNFERKNYYFNIISFSTSILTYILIIFLLHISNDNKTYSSYRLYFETHVPKLTVRDFGVLTEMRIDLKRTLFGFEEEVKTIEKEEVIPVEKEIIYNQMNIDFDNLILNENNETIKNMHEYFRNEMPTNQNDYTGMFEGKNLIVILAEAFSPMSINEELTPTLYKMYNEGFQFTNFYSPIYYVSTSDGEYVSLTSLLPKDGTWSMSTSSKNYLPFTYGNIFKELGYSTRAYHNGTYTFYNRNLSHPNMGYKFKACYGGLNINCGVWPQSDIEMIEASVDEYINDEHFMTYYMTVSGHLQYTYIGNSMATKNRNYVKDLPYSEKIQAYLATQIELDKALELLINKLSDAGKLDDTVIAISADHYPYGLTNDEIKSYSDYIIDEKFDIHKNAFLIWNNKMEKSIKVTKYASSLDIVPTIFNLFNLEYDSRLLIGKDILSDSEGLIIFNDRSWITSSGKYDSVKDEFIPFKDNISDEYVDNINNEVYNKFLMSKLILEKDYYRKVFKK